MSGCPEVGNRWDCALLSIGDQVRDVLCTLYGIMEEQVCLRNARSLTRHIEGNSRPRDHTRALDLRLNVTPLHKARRADAAGPTPRDPHGGSEDNQVRAEWAFSVVRSFRRGQGGTGRSHAAMRYCRGHCRVTRTRSAHRRLAKMSHFPRGLRLLVRHLKSQQGVSLSRLVETLAPDAEVPSNSAMMDLNANYEGDLHRIGSPDTASHRADSDETGVSGFARPKTQF